MGILPKSSPNKNLPITARKKAVPGVKPVEPSITVIEEKILPKEEKKVLPKTPPKRQPPAVPMHAPAKEHILIGEGTDPAELINRRQRQIILHSVLYYRMNTNLVTDKQWDTWARELVKLHKDYPKIAEKSEFWECMKDFDATTGFHLADNQWGINKAQWLLGVLKTSKKGGIANA